MVGMHVTPAAGLSYLVCRPHTREKRCDVLSKQRRHTDVRRPACYPLLSRVERCAGER